MSLMKRILFILLVMALREASPESLWDKAKKVDLDDKVEKVHISENVSTQFVSVEERAEDLWRACVILFKDIDTYCSGVNTDKLAVDMAVLAENIVNLENEIRILRSDLEYVAVMLKTMEALND